MANALSKLFSPSAKGSVGLPFHSRNSPGVAPAVCAGTLAGGPAAVTSAAIRGTKIVAFIGFSFEGSKNREIGGAGIGGIDGDSVRGGRGRAMHRALRADRDRDERGRG